MPSPQAGAVASTDEQQAMLGGMEEPAEEEV
jgi:hypothetical protein